MKNWPDDLPVWSDPERMGGTPCFYNTRVPVTTLFDYLQDNYSIDQFVDAFEGVKREDAAAVLEYIAKQFDLKPDQGI
ncbi:MAG: DUF433 domain-containing protein [Planctomycetota bacterium]